MCHLRSQCEPKLRRRLRDRGICFRRDREQGERATQLSGATLRARISHCFPLRETLS